MIRRRLGSSLRGTSVFVVVLVASGILLGSYFEYKPPLFWRLLGDVNTPRARHENSYVEANGNFYLIGGRGTRKITKYNPADSSWTEGVHTPNQISLHHFQAAAIGDTIYIIGAYTNTFPTEDAVPNVYKYDTVSEQWFTGPEIPEARRRGSTGVAVYNNKLYMVAGSVGGHSGSATRLTLFDEYDPFTNTWTTLSNAPHARDHVNVGVVGDKLYVAGGRNGSNGDNVEEVDVYDFGTQQWSTLPSPAGDLPTPRAGAATVVVAGHIVVIGGESTQQLAHSEVEALNTQTNTWISMNSLMIGRHGTQAVFHNDNIYIAAGSGEKGGGPELDSHEILETNGQTTLPVEFPGDLSAVVDGQTVLLTWSTLTETNNAGFEIQHQVGGQFESIGFVQGAGTVLSPQSYEFTSGAVEPGRHVFRLKQIDFNGTFAYSEEVTVLVELDGAFHLGAVYPNPLNPEARFTMTIASEQHVRLEVFDMLGRSVGVVHDGILRPATPYTFDIQAASWAGGKYFLHATGEFFSASRPFTVLK